MWYIISSCLLLTANVIHLFIFAKMWFLLRGSILKNTRINEKLVQRGQFLHIYLPFCSMPASTFPPSFLIDFPYLWSFADVPHILHMQPSSRHRSTNERFLIKTCSQMLFVRSLLTLLFKSSNWAIRLSTKRSSSSSSSISSSWIASSSSVLVFEEAGVESLSSFRSLFEVVLICCKSNLGWIWRHVVTSLATAANFMTWLFSSKPVSNGLTLTMITLKGSTN